MRVAAVVPAAGGSARFGKPKQFALFQGETFVKRIVADAIDAGRAPVVVVTGEQTAAPKESLWLGTRCRIF
jgi:CTP:molybdopterin cytidylyltransferase MocA